MLTTMYIEGTDKDESKMGVVIGEGYGGHVS